MLKHLLIPLMLAIGQYVFAQNWTNTTNIWERVELDFSSLENNKSHNSAGLNLYRLDEKILLELLNDAPAREFANLLNKNKNKNNYRSIVPLPKMGGGQHMFQLMETSVLHPELSKRYPDIKSYKGFSINQLNVSVYLDISPRGLHAMILNESGKSIFIDPIELDGERYYSMYTEKNKVNKKNWNCYSKGKEINRDNTINNEHTKAFNCGTRIFRLALSCTGEYAQYFGGTREATLAAMHTTVNRVNGIFERDLSVSFQLVEENDELIFLNPYTDPFSNYNAWNLITENQDACDNIIGTGSYDLGHVFSTGGGGLAQVRSICEDGLKAQAASGIVVPEGDPFIIDYVAHELGHQLGASHTHNNNCNRHVPTSVEPGSGSSIMGYAGICSPNIQENSDPYFHAISIQEINDHLQKSTINCGLVHTANGQLLINAGGDFTIPKLTPFKLTGYAQSGENNGHLIYNWEQADNEIAIMPPVAVNKNGPLFRSYPPVELPFRYFPKLSSIIDEKEEMWEVLPNCEREMNFIFSVRNNLMENSCIELDFMQTNVSENAGPFKIVSTGPVRWNGKSVQKIIWDVAGTDLSPVNCHNVDILFSTDGGYSYPYELAVKVANDGIHEIVVPNLNTHQGRVMVKASENIFFAISDNNITVNNSAELWALNEAKSLGRNKGSSFPDQATDTDLSDEETVLHELKAFPNPVQEKLTITFFQQADGGPSITVYDMMGRKRLEKTVLYQPSDWRQEELDLSQLEAGSYVLKLEEATSVKSLRFIRT